MRSLLLIGVLATSASASPLGIAWSEKVTCEAQDYLPGVTIGETSVAWITKGKLVRRGLAKGESLAGWKLKHAERVFVTHLADDLIVVRDPFGFTAYDGAGKTRFHRIVKTNKAHWNALAVGGGKILFEVAGSIEADDLTGKKLWSVPFGKKEFTAGLELGTTLAFLVTGDAKTQTIHALALGDGHEAWKWTSEPGTIDTTIQRDGDVVAVSGHDTLQLLDATGVVTWKAAVPSQRVIQIDAATIYTAGSVGGLFAYERASGKQRWKRDTVTTTGLPVVATSATSVYAQDRDRLVELDPKTGAERASLGVAKQQLAARGSTIVACDGGKKLVAYAPTAPDLKLEKATVTGKVTAEYLTPDVTVSIAGATGKLDGESFKLSINGRGRYSVWVVASGVWHEAKSKVVDLTGKGAYDVGTVDVEPEVEGD